MCNEPKPRKAFDILRTTVKKVNLIEKFMVINEKSNKFDITFRARK